MLAACATGALGVAERVPSATVLDAVADPFCVDGHRIPSLFLLGWAKCGTTSTAMQLQQDFGVQMPGKFNDTYFQDAGKEPHFFDTVRVKQGLSLYASVYPECSANDTTAANIALDASPSYVFSNKTLERIIKLYGAERISRSTFAAQLCDPLQRVQSAYYHFHYSKNHSNWLADWMGKYYDWEVMSEPFGAYVNKKSKKGFFNTIRKARENGKMDAEVDDLGLDAVEREFVLSLYPEFLKPTLEKFGHLAILPSAEYFKDSQAALLELVTLAKSRTYPASSGGGGGSSSSGATSSRSGSGSASSSSSSSSSRAAEEQEGKPELAPKIQPPFDTGHPDLTDEGISDAAGSDLRHLYRDAIRQTYDMLDDPRITVVPARDDNWKRYLFFETSSILKKHAAERATWPS